MWRQPLYLKHRLNSCLGWLLHRPLPEATEADRAIVLDVSREGKEAGQLRLTLAPNQRCVFGRQPGGCDVVLEHLSISRQHAHLSMDLNGRCFITDMGSVDV